MSEKTETHGLVVRRHADGRVEVRNSDPTRTLLAISCGLVALGGIGVQLHGVVPLWLAWVGLLPLCLGGLLVGAWAIATTAERETRGVITHTRRITLRPAAGARYRSAAQGPTLEAAGRSWPLSDLRSIEVGRKDKSNHFLYIVMPDEVLVLAEHENEAADTEAMADAVANALGAPRAPELREDRDWQGQSWAPALLVSVPLGAWIAGVGLAARELLVESAAVPPLAVAAALILVPAAWRAIIVHRTRRMLLPLARAYARERFGIEPRA